MAGFTKVQYIWMNGSLVSWEAAQVHVTAHALQYGTGVFEGMRAYDTSDGAAIFRLDAHMRRFFASATHYDIEIPYSIDQVSEASLDVVRANGLENAYLRPIAFFDSHSFAVMPRECPVSVSVIAVPGRSYVKGNPEHGQRVTVVKTRRIDASVLPPTVKACGHYTNSVRAIQEAARAGYDDAIMLNSKGDVAEGSGANLFLVKGGSLITNDAEASILMGITRDTVLEIARDLDLPVTIRPLTLDDLASADECFYCGTAVEVMPIKEIGGRVIGDGTPGPTTRRIQKAFFDAVHGRDARYHKWLAHAGSGVVTTS